ncbi:MAG: hypothetical protein HFG22_08105 [Lachnospiraceae bacterium]|nr:hypothetical protein [Lachnospiraceae bacterium]
MDRSTQLQEALDGFITVIKDLTTLAGDLTRIERAKADAASQKQHHVLDDCIQDEQAYILKLRGFEQHRIKQMKILGWDGLTFRQVLEKADPDQKERLTPLFTALEQQLTQLTQAKGAADQIIRVRVHELERLIALQGGSGYDSGGKVDLGAPSHSKMKDRYV